MVLNKSLGISKRKREGEDFESLGSIKKPQKAEVVVAPLIKYIQDFGSSDAKGAWEIEMKISQYYFAQNKIKEALAHAKASFDIAPEKHRNDIVLSIQYLESHRLEIEARSYNESR